MDVNAIQALAGQLDAEAQRLVGIIGSVESLVRRAGAEWHGPSSIQFAADWHNRYRPAMQRAHDSIAGLASSARNNAAEQVRASTAAAASNAIHAPRVRIAYATDRPASAQQYESAEKYAHNMISRYSTEFPGATAELKQWADRLQSGTASSADVEAMRRYAILIEIAHMQRDTVHSAALLAVDNVKDAASSDVDSAKSFASIFAPASGHSARFDFAQGTATDVASGALEDKIAHALLHGRPDAMVQAYDSSTDSLLQQIGTQAQTSGPLVHVEYSNAFEQVDILQGRLDEQNYYGIANDATHMVTGDGSVVDTAGTNFISAIPGWGKAYDGLSGAMSAVHGNNAAAIALHATDIANFQSVVGVENAARSLQLIPAGE
jgi:uncharacterized protein YukE